MEQQQLLNSNNNKNCCHGNSCLIHLHSCAGHAWLLSRIRPFHPKLKTNIQLLASRFASSLNNLSPFPNAIAILPATLKPQYTAILAAAVAAGFQSFLIVERPIMAAFHYDYLSQTPKTYLVLDLDHDILEISLVTKYLQLKSTVGNLGCPLLTTMVQETLRNTGIDLCANSAELFRLLQACERAKDALCGGMRGGALKFQRRDMRLRRWISGREVVEMNVGLLREGIGKCLWEGGVWKGEVDEVILAGVKTCIPEVQEAVREFFEGKPIRCEVDPVELIRSSARGLADLMSHRHKMPFFSITDVLNVGDFYF